MCREVLKKLKPHGKTGRDGQEAGFRRLVKELLSFDNGKE